MRAAALGMSADDLAVRVLSLGFRTPCDEGLILTAGRAAYDSNGEVTMKGLFPYISSFRQRAVAVFHRTDPLKATSDERQARWSEVIAEHQKPLKPQKDSAKIT
jgi:hypothetical protein